jgi:hypothetical protein
MNQAFRGFDEHTYSIGRKCDIAGKGKGHI